MLYIHFLTYNQIYVFCYKDDYENYKQYDCKNNVTFVQLDVPWRSIQKKRVVIQNYFIQRPNIERYILIDDDVIEFAKDYWSFDTGYEQSNDINIQIEKIYRRIENKVKEINFIKKTFNAESGFLITVKQGDGMMLPAIYFENENNKMILMVCG